jgi:hypothetical protein
MATDRVDDSDNEGPNSLLERFEHIVTSGGKFVHTKTGRIYVLSSLLWVSPPFS